MLFFYRCLHYFSSVEKLDVHSVECQKMIDCAIQLPTEDEKWLSFRNVNNKEREPFVVYADLECTLEKMEKKDMEISYQQHHHHHHQVFSLGCYVHCSYDDALSGY
ncbi:uncharacterized protein LOC118645722 [Monomorium pharaonis]|uniref:uncharacterized protein LOC118645722 n=1 Tax=Monomorium pharaonis TaxID=307658 RepID=UPI001745CE71|nr:uncharacterized protein LOC118645722 [Monomorium pharaonis]